MQTVTAAESEPPRADSGPGERAGLVLGGLAGLALPVVLLGTAAMAAALGLAELGALAWLWRDRGAAWRAIGWSRPLVALATATFLRWLLAAAVDDQAYKAVTTVLRTAVYVLGWLVLVAVLPLRARMWRAFLKTGLAGALVALGYSVLTMYVWPPALALVDALHSDPAGRYLYFKSFASVAVLLVPALLFAGAVLGGRWRWLAVAGAPLAGLVVFGGGEAQFSRAALAGLAGAAAAPAALAGLLRLGPAARRTLLVLLAVGGVAGGAAYLHDLPRPPWTAAQADQLAALPDPHRQVIWGFVWTEALDNPVLGVGPNTINMVPGAKRPIPSAGIRFGGAEYLPSHPHNWVLEIAAETGFPGLALFLATLAAALAGVMRVAGTRRALEPAALFAVSIAGGYLVSALANFSFWASWWQNAFLLAVLPAATYILRPPARTATPAAWGRADAAATALGAAGVVLALGLAVAIHPGPIGGPVPGSGPDGQVVAPPGETG